MKIALISLFDTNLGEELIKDCAEFLIKKAAAQKNKAVETEIHSLFPNGERFEDLNRFRSCLNRTIRLIFWKFNLPEFLKPAFVFCAETAAILKWHFQQKNDPKIKNYCEKIAKSADIVVTAGGGFLSHFDLNIWAPFYALLCACERAKTPVYMNCMGIEKPSAAFSLLFRVIFSKKCIKHATIRDDIKTALKYVKNKHHCELAGDPALWAAECYGIQKHDSETIGVNIVREGLFLENGGSLSPDEAKNAYVNIVNELISRGYKVRLFTNGLKADEEMAQKVLKSSNLVQNPNALAKCPQTGRQLAETISTCKAIIGTRMHCAIAAVSEDIPCVEVLWKPKQVHFARLINRSGWFFTQKEFQDAKFVVNLLETAINEGYDRKIISNLKNLAYDNLEKHLFE